VNHLTDRQLYRKLILCDHLLRLSTARELPEVKQRRDAYFNELFRRNPTKSVYERGLPD
jgi:hypothetical protein